jgi:WD40 repeat protein
MLASARATLRLFGTALALATVAAPVHAQADSTRPTILANGKKALTVADYSKWRNIEDAVISPDGRWVSYALRFANTLPQDGKPVLHLRNLDTNQEVEIANAHDGTFSLDSRWLVYQVDSVPAPRGGRGRGAGANADSGTATNAQGAAGRAAGAATQPPRVELRELASGRTQSWQRMQSASFNVTSTHLLLQRRAAPGGGRGRGAGPGGATAPASNARGTDAIVHDLATDRGLFLGSVGDISFNRQGDLLAYTVDAQVNDGNGLYLLDLRSSRTHVLDNDTLTYARLTWSDDGSRIAVLKGHPVEKMRERDNQLLAFGNLRAATDDPEAAPMVLDRSRATGFPKDFVVSERAPLTWSEDGRLVFLGIIPQRAAPDTARRPSTDSLANVDIWRSQDDRIQSVQMIRAEADRNFTFRQAFDMSNGRYITLSDSSMRSVEVSPDGRWAVGRDETKYVSDWKRPEADLYRVNTATGERTLIVTAQPIQQHLLGFSPDGDRYLYWRDGRFQAYDIDAGSSRTLATANGGFANMEWDYPGTRPSYGVAGYASDGSGVVAQHRYDLWLLPFDGSAARNLTKGVGAKSEMRLRYLQTEPIDSAAPRRVPRPTGWVSASCRLRSRPAARPSRCCCRCWQ